MEYDDIIKLLERSYDYIREFQEEFGINDSDILDELDDMIGRIGEAG